MENKVYYNQDEEVEYFSQVDHTWKREIISRFTEDGFTTVAIIWEGTSVNKIPLNKEYIRKIIRR